MPQTSLTIKQAFVRLSSIATGIYMAQQGLEPVIQMTCRDRNRLAIQSDLMGAYFHGIRNVLCLSGDHQSFGNHPGAKNVQDIDSMQLIQMIKEMRDKNQFQCGDEIKGGGPKLLIGGCRQSLFRTNLLSTPSNRQKNGGGR